MPRKLRFLILAAALLSACSPSGDEKEPNNDFTHATPMSANGKMEGTIKAPDDEDWFKISVSRDSGVLDLRVGGIRDIDFVISFRDKDRQELKRIDETGVGGDEEALDLGVARGDYYVVLSNKNPKANNPHQKYALKAKLESSSGREMEPNDKALNANALETNGVTRGHYYPTQNLLADDEEKGEEDWFRVNVPQAGMFILNLDLSEVPKVDPVMEVYDGNLYKVKEVNDRAVGESESLKDFGVKAPAQFLLRLRTRGRRVGNPDVFYELLSELRPYDGRTEFEPNDQRLDATPFERDSLTGHIAPAGDADWFRVNADTASKQLLRADVSAVPGMDLMVTVADELGQTMLVVDNGGKEVPESLTGLGLTNATYYLAVAEKTGKASDARHSYSFSKSLVAWQPGLEWEPNNSSATAQGIKVGESVDGYLAPKGDVEFYEFNVYQKGSIVFELAGVLNVRWSMELFDQDSRSVASVSSPKPGDSLSFDKELEPGTYWLKLKGMDPAQNNVRDKYTLRLRAR